MSGKWEVWSVHVNEGRALIVDEGTEKHARASAGRRNEAATRHIPALVFLALPEGSRPSRQQAEAVLKERETGA